MVGQACLRHHGSPQVERSGTGGWQCEGCLRGNRIWTQPASGPFNGARCNGLDTSIATTGDRLPHAVNLTNEQVSRFHRGLRRVSTSAKIFVVVRLHEMPMALARAAAPFCATGKAAGANDFAVHPFSFGNEPYSVKVAKVLVQLPPRPNWRHRLLIAVDVPYSGTQSLQWPPHLSICDAEFTRRSSSIVLESATSASDVR